MLFEVSKKFSPEVRVKTRPRGGFRYLAKKVFWVTKDSILQKVIFAGMTAITPLTRKWRGSGGTITPLTLNLRIFLMHFT